MKDVFEFRFKGTAKGYLDMFWNRSLASLVMCTLCTGKGFIPFQDGADDFVNQVCEACGGTGKFITDNI